MLQYSVKLLNDSIGPDGLIPEILVYGAFPRLCFPSDKPAPGIYERSVAARKATEEMTLRFALRQLKAALRSRNGPETANIKNTTLGYNLLVYRTKTIHGKDHSSY